METKTYEGDCIQADIDEEGDLSINFAPNGVTLFFMEEDREDILNELKELVLAFK